MNKWIAVVLLSLPVLPNAATAATAANTFRVGITIESRCDVRDEALHCVRPVVASTRSLPSGDVLPRANVLGGESTRLRQVSADDATRMLVVEY